MQSRTTLALALWAVLASPPGLSQDDWWSSSAASDTATDDQTPPPDETDPGRDDTAQAEGEPEETEGAPDSLASPEPAGTVPVAQEPEDTGEAPPSEATALAPITVTAQKRTENLQDVSVSVTAVSGKELLERGLTNIEEITRSIPSITMTTENLLAVFNVRGIGKSSGQFDQSVTAIVDDVPLPATYVSFPFMDVASMEFLRGPQGTLFGKNNVAGAMIVRTKDPTPFWDLDGNVSYGDLNSQRLEVAANIPVIDDVFGARVRYTSQQRDGYMHNTTLSEEDGEMQRDAGGLKMVFTPMPNLRLASTTLYTTLTLPHGWGYQAILCTDEFVTQAQASDPDFECDVDWNSAHNLGENTDDWAWIQNVAATYSLDNGYDLKSFASYHQYDIYVLVDADYSPTSALSLPLFVTGNAQSAEVRLISPESLNLWDRDFSFVSGLFYNRENQDLDTSLFVAPVDSGDPNRPTSNEEIRLIQDKRTTEIAAFAQAEYALLDDLEVTLGARFSTVEAEDLRAENQVYCFTLPAQCELATAGDYDNRVATNVSDTDNALSYKVALGYYLIDDWLTYASYATSFKASGYGLQVFEDDDGNNVPDRYRAEHGKSYELGSKLTLFGGAARVNGTLFLSRFDDFQVPLVRLFATELGNADQVETRGAELETQFLLPLGMLFSVNGSYLDAKYVDYVAPCPNGEQGENHDNDPRTSVVCDLSGRTLPYAPKWKGSVLLSGQWQPFDWPFKIRAGGDAVWQDLVYFQTDTDPNDSQDAYWRFNAQAGIAGLADSWSLTAFVKNIANGRHLQASNDIPAFGGSHWGSLAAPRTVHVTFSWNFL